MKIDIEFLKPYTGTLVWDCLNTVLSEDLRFAEPKKTPQEIVKETNEWLNAAKGTLFAAIDEIGTALDGKDEAQREHYVFNILKGFHPIAFVYDDWYLKHLKSSEERQNKIIEGEEERLANDFRESLEMTRQDLSKRELLHKKIFASYRRTKSSTPMEQCLYWFHEWAMWFGQRLNPLLKAYDVSIDKIAKRYPVQFQVQECNVYACAILLCLSYEKRRNPYKEEKSFRDIIQYEDPDKLLARLHHLIDGKGGADVGTVIMNAKHINGFLSRHPTKAEFKSEFDLIGSWSAIHNYFEESSNTALAKAGDIIIFP